MGCLQLFCQQGEGEGRTSTYSRALHAVHTCVVYCKAHIQTPAWPSVQVLCVQRNTFLLPQQP